MHTGMSSTTTHPWWSGTGPSHYMFSLPPPRAVSLTTVARCDLIDPQPHPSLTLTVWWCFGSYDSDLTATDTWITDNVAYRGGGGVPRRPQRSQPPWHRMEEQHSHRHQHPRRPLGSSPTCGSTCDPGFYGNCTRVRQPIRTMPLMCDGPMPGVPSGYVSGRQQRHRCRRV